MNRTFMEKNNKVYCRKKVNDRNEETHCFYA